MSSGPISFFTTGMGAGKRQSHKPPIAPVVSAEGRRSVAFPVQAAGVTAFKLPHYPFQALPSPNGPAPYRFDLSQLLSAADVTRISNGSLVFHTVGDTGDFRGRQQDFVARLMTQDADNLGPDKKPAFFYHLGDVVYFAGDVDK